MFWILFNRNSTRLLANTQVCLPLTGPRPYAPFSRFILAQGKFEHANAQTRHKQGSAWRAIQIYASEVANAG